MGQTYRQKQDRIVVNPISVVIIAGFLGAGRTALVNAILSDPDFSETAVLTELGGDQINRRLASEFTDDLIMTTTGCLCYTASDGIKPALFELWNKRKNREINPFRRVIVDKMSTVHPATALNSLLPRSSTQLIDKTVSREYALSGVVTIFDAANGPQSLDGHVAAIKQVALADIVLPTRSDPVHDPSPMHNIEAHTPTYRQQGQLP